MKYPYILVKNGVWYSSGSDVPEDTEPIANTNNSKYKKTDINRMPISELKDLAEQYHIPNAQNLVGTDLKKLIIEKLGL